MPGHQGEIQSALFAEGGKTLITGSEDRTVRFWDLTTGRKYGSWKAKRARSIVSR